MKDMLYREIVVGDTLASPSHSVGAFPFLRLSKVTAVADFAIQLTDIQAPESKVPPEPFVISDASRYVICDWAKGSQVV